MKLTPLFALCCVITSYATTAPAANDSSLYAEAAPADASFVRFIGFVPGQTAQFAGKEFVINAEDALAYIPVSSALLDDVAPGSFVTVARTDAGDALIIPEAPRNDAARVHLLLVNSTGKVLELRLADGSATVIENVESASAGVRAVNPVAIALGVFEQGHDAPLATFDVSLKRGQNISFIADGTSVRLVENRFGLVAK